jgi:hypothetical protein
MWSKLLWSSPLEVWNLYSPLIMPTGGSGKRLIILLLMLDPGRWVLGIKEGYNGLEASQTA